MTILDIENLDSENKLLKIEEIKLNKDKIDEMFYFKAYIDGTIEEVLKSKNFKIFKKGEK